MDLELVPVQYRTNHNGYEYTISEFHGKWLLLRRSPNSRGATEMLTEHGWESKYTQIIGRQELVPDLETAKLRILEG